MGATGFNRSTSWRSAVRGSCVIRLTDTYTEADGLEVHLRVGHHYLLQGVGEGSKGGVGVVLQGDIATHSSRHNTTHPVHLKEESSDGESSRGIQRIGRSNLDMDDVQLQRIPATNKWVIWAVLGWRPGGCLCSTPSPPMTIGPHKALQPEAQQFSYFFPSTVCSEPWLSFAPQWKWSWRIW